MIVKTKIKRILLKKIQNKLFQGKVIIIYGARQVGKTTLVQDIISNYPNQAAYFNCDEPDIRQALENRTSTQLKAFLGDHTLIILDEAQRVSNIGLTLKLLVDNFPQLQIIATGSSSFELSNNLVEPLTGRNYEFHLYPFTVSELQEHFSQVEENRLLERRLIYGMYPDVALQKGKETDQVVKRIAHSYLYKDILVFQKIRQSEVLEKLLQALALQLSNEVSYNELSQIVGVDKNTIQQYIQILEQAFIVFRLRPFSRNIRNELKRLRKIYFFDNGIRNALINNFNALELRNDTGALWENFMISERIKRNAYWGHDPNMYFWRTHNQQEIDLIEEAGGKLTGYEFKWQAKTYTPPQVFLENYSGSQVQLVSREHYQDFISHIF